MVGKAAGFAVALALACSIGARAQGETFLEQNAEFRTQLDFVVPDAALRKFLPAGWASPPRARPRTAMCA
jgi:hypothetical protein